MADYFARLTLGRLLVALSVFSMAIAFVLIFFVSGMVRDRAVNDLAQEDARQASRLAFQTLYSAMRKGWSKQEINETITRLNTTLPDVKIRVFRGPVVAREFGEMKGERELIEQDSALGKAMSSGQNTLLFPDKTMIRYLYPVVATEECLRCHKHSGIGEVHGVIDIVYPISNLKISFNHVINTVIAYTLIIIGLVFIVLYFQLRYLVVTPISNLVDVMRNVTSDMDFSHRVGASTWLHEVKHLAGYFNHLLKTVQDYNAKLEELSIRDPLTGLYNRRKFQEFIRYEIIRATRNQRGFSIIMIDLDNFKYINNTFGRPIGDMVLKEFGVMLGEGLRRCDVLARLGSDEFAIILPETGAANGFQVATKLHQALSAREFELPVGKVRSTVSFGMVSFPEDGQTEEQICSAMEAMLYKAKTHSESQEVVTAESGEGRSVASMLKQGEFLRNAIRENRIEAFLQPIVNVQTRAVVAFEILVRILDGEVIVPADKFIEVAEEMGMAKELDRQMFDRALVHYAKVSVTHPQAKFFINLFPRSFGDLDWVRAIPDLARKAGVPCENIVLEITEREALPNLTQVRAVIEELRASKIAVALDDFGSGFSSFLYLKYLSVDYVKIEGSFVRNMANDERDRIIVGQINSMAHQFGLKTVAEFVEDETTAGILAEIGVDYAQGYHYGHPALPA